MYLWLLFNYYYTFYTVAPANSHFSKHYFYQHISGVDVYELY